MAESLKSLDVNPAREAVELQASPEEDHEEIDSDSLVYGRDVQEWEALWESLLLSDYMEILSRAVDPVEYSSKKELYFRLHQPLLLDQGTKSFVLDMATGKKCYMLSARALGITWGGSPQYWTWTHHPNSRFAEVAELLDVCWLDVNGTINSSQLSPNTTYAAYLIFELPAEKSAGFAYETHKASVSIGTATPIESIVRIEPQEEDGQDGLVPTRRKDGWMELCLGKFYSREKKNEEIRFALREIEGQWKSGLIVEGIEEEVAERAKRAKEKAAFEAKEGHGFSIKPPPDPIMYTQTAGPSDEAIDPLQDILQE